MKKTIQFSDKNNNLFKIAIELKDNVFSASGEGGGYIGQCQHRIEPKNEAQRKLIELWNEWHLNDAQIGTKKQREALRSQEFQDFRENRIERTDYELALMFLTAKELLVDENYQYGSGLFPKQLPENFQADLQIILQEIEELERV